MNNKIANRTVWILSGLLAVALIAAIYFGVKNYKYENETEKLEEDLSALNQTHEELNAELVTLDNDYVAQIEENEALIVELEERVKEVDRLKYTVSQARQKLTKSEKANEEITQKLVQLEELKVSLEEEIDQLLEQNDILITANQEIRDEIEESKMTIHDLNDRLIRVTKQNDALVSRLKEIAPAGFVADNFSVLAQKRNDKLTIKSRQTDEIKVGFDINNVPVEYRLKEKIYLVITEFDGNPVEQIPSQSVKINSATPIHVSAADIADVELKDQQRLEMVFAPEDRLDSGMYNVLVYAGHGFLGATTFELR
jgi:hypothetical protein